MKSFVIGASILMAGISLGYAQSEYVQPQQNRLMFHVDKLPLSKARCTILSEQLTALVRREHDGSAQQHRLSAQTLMLAIRLNPANQDAQRVNQDLANGIKPAAPDQVESTKAMFKIQRIMNGLLASEKGSEAHLLAAYMKDVMIAYMPSDPIYAGHQVDNSRWKGILPALPKPVITDEPKPRLTDTENPKDVGNVVNKPNRGEKPPVKKDVFTRWKQQQSTLTLPLQVIHQEGEYDSDGNELVAPKSRTELVVLDVTVSPKQGSKSSLSLSVTPSVKDDQLSQFKGMLSSMMNNRFKKYDAVGININTAVKIHSNSRGQLSLPVCLQLMASANGVKLKKGTMVIGVLYGDRIRKGYEFWEKFQYILLDKTKSGRLIVAAEAEPEIIQLIALEKESFFIRNEVLTAGNVQEAAEMLGDSSVPEIKEASDDFAEIQKHIGTKSIGPYAVDKKMRQRLQNIVDKNPNHLSAKMILLRGDATRNKRLERFFIAREANTILNSISWMCGKESYEVGSGYLMKGMKAIDDFDAAYRRLIDTEDRDIGRSLSDVYETLEDLVRMKKKNESKTNNKAMSEAMLELTSRCKASKALFQRAMKERSKLGK